MKRRRYKNIEDIKWDQVLSTEKGKKLSDLVKERIRTDKTCFLLHDFERQSALVLSLCNEDEAQFRMLESAVEEVFAGCVTKRANFETRIGRPSDYAKSIISDEEIHDHRTNKSLALHVGLQVLAFGEFMDTVKRGADDSVRSQFYHVASNLMQKMSGTFQYEADRSNCFYDVIKDLGDNFCCNIDQSTGYLSDGTVKDNDNNILVNWEFKNELFGFSSCPNRQNIAYFVHMKKGKTGHSPMLLVSVVGCHYLQVFGATWDGEKRVCVDPLSSPVSLLFVPRDPSHGVTKVAVLLSALDKAINCLRSHYSTSSEPVDNGPYWIENGLTYKQKLVQHIPWLFDASYNGGNAVVKFVRDRYGDAVHRFLECQNYAPKLFCCERLAGGWYVIVMEKVEGRLLIDCESVDQSIKESLKLAVEAMHNNHMVHGDLRPQNILIVANSSPVILDFDWAGMHGEATYPAELNNDTDLNWHKDVKARGKIEHVHDLYQIEQL